MADRYDYNRYGERLSITTLKRPIDWAFMNAQGLPLWNDFLENADDLGFAHGAFTTDEGTDYGSLALPYTEESMPYHEYVVEGKCEVECVVDRGRVAAGFGSKGGAVQYRHYHTMKESIALGILKEDFGWLKKIQEIA